MGLVEVARFASLIEAQVAAGALRSAGLDVELYDAGLGSMDYFLQQAIGGFRLMAPAGEASEARSLLADLQAAAPAPQAAPAGGRLRALAAVLLTFVLGAEGGFLMAKTGDRLPED